MKKVALFLFPFVMSCEKNNELKVIKEDIIGTWELEKFVGFPFTQPAFPPGNGNIIVIAEGGDFERRQHDTVLFRGIYSLGRKKDCYERNNDIIFSTNESSSGNYHYVDIENGKLSLSTPNCYQDGGTAYYRRL